MRLAKSSMTLSSVKYCVYQYNSTRNVFLIITGMQLPVSWILSHLMRHYRQPLYMLALVHVLCELLDVSLVGGVCIVSVLNLVQRQETGLDV